MKILTFNCAALPVLTPRIEERLQRLAAEIRKLDPDVVCLQEVCLGRHLRLLASALEGWPHLYAKVRPSGLVEGALATFSKRPFVREEFTPFREQGPWLSQACLARLSRKGWTVLELAGSGLRIVHSHPLANYSAGRRTFVRYPERQALQFAQLIEAVRPLLGGADVVLAGDLNVAPEDAPYASLRGELGFVDLMGPASGPSTIGRAFGSSLVPGRSARLDYVLYRPGKGSIGEAGSARYVLDEGEPLSDHRGVLAEIRLASSVS